MKIILFLLMAMIIDLILPNSSMKMYLKLVVGLLLILIFLQPLFSLLQTDINSAVQRAVANFELEMEEEDLKKSIELNKKEIEASQQAYILEQMVVQMKNQVEEGLDKEYGAEIIDIMFTFQEGEALTFETLTQVDVLLREKAGTEKPQGAVEEIVIDVERQPEEEAEAIPETEVVHQYLFQAWQLENQKLMIQWEGG